MRVGIHKDVYRSSPFVARYQAILDYNGIDHLLLDASAPQFWEEVATLDLFVFRWNHTDYHHQLAGSILPVIQNELKVRCFPDHDTCWHFDDKVKQYYLLRRHGFPMTRSWVFWEKGAALSWAESAQFPVVFKLSGGAGSQNVVLVENRAACRKLIRVMFGRGVASGRIPSRSNMLRQLNDLCREARSRGGRLLRWLSGEDYHRPSRVHRNYVLFQEFLPGNAFDTRVTVIGERAFAFRRMNRKGDFRSSGSGMIDYDMDKIDLRCIEKAFEISRKMKFQSMAYDFLNDPQGEVQFCEISYTYDDLAIFNCPGYWDEGLTWCAGHFWPEYLHLADCLQRPDLRQPDLGPAPAGGAGSSR